MKTTYIQFLVDVSGIGTYWSADKHAKEWTLEEKGSWVIFTNTSNGQRRRVPITSISALHEIQVEVPAPAKSKASV